MVLCNGCTIENAFMWLCLYCSYICIYVHTICKYMHVDKSVCAALVVLNAFTSHWASVDETRVTKITFNA